MTLKLKLAIPELRIIGKYVTSGRVLLLEVNGAGTFWNVLGRIALSLHFLSLRICFIFT